METSRRRQFGRDQPFGPENLGTEPFFSEFRVSNPVSKSSYRVAIRGRGPGGNFCSCLWLNWAPASIAWVRYGRCGSSISWQRAPSRRAGFRCCHSSALCRRESSTATVARSHPAARGSTAGSQRRQDRCREHGLADRRHSRRHRVCKDFRRDGARALLQRRVSSHSPSGIWRPWDMTLRADGIKTMYTLGRGVRRTQRATDPGSSSAARAVPINYHSNYRRRIFRKLFMP
jgi:hypothetical protein